MSSELNSSVHGGLRLGDLVVNTHSNARTRVYKIQKFRRVTRFKSPSGKEVEYIQAACYRMVLHADRAPTIAPDTVGLWIDVDKLTKVKKKRDALPSQTLPGHGKTLPSQGLTRCAIVCSRSRA